MQQSGGNSPPGATAETLPTAQPRDLENPEERFIVVRGPRENRPFDREHVVEAMLCYGIDFEAMGRFWMGVEFQILLENRSDTDRLTAA